MSQNKHALSERRVEKCSRRIRSPVWSDRIGAVEFMTALAAYVMSAASK